MRRILIPLLLLLVFSGCAPKQFPPNLTPEQQAQYTKVYKADEVLIRVQELQNITIQSEANGDIPTPTARVLVQFTVDAATVLKTTPDGWKASVTTLWNTAKANPYLKPYLTNAYISVAVTLVDAAISSWGS
jgi:hypothetical protein